MPAPFTDPRGSVSSSGFHFRTFGRIWRFSIQQRRRRNGGKRSLLRNEPGWTAALRNELGIGFATLCLELYQRVEGFIEGALMGGAIAHKQGKLGHVNAGFRERLVLQMDGALHEPVRLRHFLYKQLFGSSGGRVLGKEIFEQRFKLGRVLAGHNHAAGSEPVLEGIAARRGLAVSTARSGGPGSFLSLRLAEERGLIRWVGPEARAGMDASA